MNYCGVTYMKFYELFGLVLLIFKCFIPLLIIIFGTFDMFNFVIKSKNEKNTDKIKKFLKRIIAGMIIFFMPNIILTIFESVGLNKTEYSCMYNCVLDITKCNYVEINENNE